MWLLVAPRTSRAELPAQPSVVGAAVTEVEVGTGPPGAHGATEHAPWSTLAATNVPPGSRRLTFPVPAGTEAVRVPVCAGRQRVLLDDVDVNAKPGPVVVDVPADGRAHRISVELDVSGYEHRVACGEPPRVGARGREAGQTGLVVIDFASPHAGAGGGHAVVYVPPDHDPRRPATLLVGLHPWNGSMWTYAAYEPLLAAARANDVVLLFPSGLGNSLYTAAAEDEVLRAEGALEARLSIDADRITLFGASMGGAGATTIGFHHPDRFAAVVSLFGDSRYDLATYVRGILHDGAGAHLVNALDVVDNARNLPVWLVHGEDDRVSPIAQSAVLARALTAMGSTVRFDRVPGAGHEGRVVTDFAARIVEHAATVRRVAAPLRVSYWSVRPGDTSAYGVRLHRVHATGDAFFDVGAVGGAVHLFAARGVDTIRLPRGAFGLSPAEAPAVVCDDPTARDVHVVWDSPP